MKFALLILLSLCSSVTWSQQYNLDSPNKQLKLTVKLDSNGVLNYRLVHNKKIVIKNSKLGFQLINEDDFQTGLSVLKTATRTENSTWEPVLGEVKIIRNHYNELLIELKQEKKERLISVRFKLYDDGLGFRYEFPKQEKLSYFTIQKELTEFNLTDNHSTFWIPGDFDSNEYVYLKTPLSEVHSSSENEYNYLVNRTILHDSLVQTPLLMKTKESLYVTVFEAAVENYPVMHLDVNRTTFGLTSHLVKSAIGVAAFMQTPDRTPWRTILVADKSAKLLESKLILNLNEPSKLKNTEWIKPMKYVGIWWGLHVNKNSWNYADISNIKLDSINWSSVKPNGRHGATTEESMRYIDFAAKHGLDGLLIEGWNVGWEDWYGNGKEEVFDFVTPYPDFDVQKITAYAKAKGVKIIMHHETSASVTNYERRLESALDFMDKYGYKAVKTGYVGFIIPRGEHHDGQWMSRHFSFITKEMATREIMVNMHESHRPTGLNRTYPNWIASEAARGNEFNAWSSGNPPEHETILPFTRLLGGPMDYTPGIFEIQLSHYDENNKYKVHTTLAKQLALYVTMYSPLQMAADLPENYERYSDAFQFIKDVALDWDDTKVLEAEPGDYLVIARKAKGKSEWFIGGITDEEARKFDIKLDFLDKSVTYVAEIYQDGKDAHWESNPKSYEIKQGLVTSKLTIKALLKEGGGIAIRLAPATKDQLKNLKKL